MWTNRAASWMILRLSLFCRLDVRGWENLPEKPYLVVANHRGFCDVLLLIWAASAQGVSKKEVFYFPMMGLLGYLGGAVFFDRNRAEDRRRAKEETLLMLQRGNAMHIYPEGTRARDELLREKLYWGLVHAAWERGFRVLPTALWGTDRVLPVSNAGIRYGQSVRVRFGTAVEATDHATAESFTQAIWSQVTQMVTEFYSGDPSSASTSSTGTTPPTSNM